MSISVLQNAGGPARAASSVPGRPFLAAKLARLRRKVVWVSALLGVSVVVLVGVELLGLAMFLDWWIELPRGIRAISLLAQTLLASWLLARFVAWPFLLQPTDEHLALAIEKARPQLRTRLIAAVQLTRPNAIPAHASVAMVDALVEETEAIAAGIDFNSIVSQDRLRTIGTAAGCVFVVALALFVYGLPDTSQLLKRAMLYNVAVPRKTRVDVPAGSRRVGRGDDVRIEAHASGIVPDAGILELRSVGQRPQRYNLARNGTVFTRTIENVQASFEYSVRLNDGRSEWFDIKVLPRPAVSSISCEQQFPAYTQLRSRNPPLTDLTLLAGSLLRLRVVPTKDIVSAQIKLVGTDVTLPMEVRDPRAIHGEFRVPAKGVNGFSVLLRDADGMESKDPAAYRLDIIPDKPPSVRITSPARREDLFTRQATAIVAMEVADDFQIAKLRLRYKTEGTGDDAAKTIELDLGNDPGARLQRRFEWMMNSVDGGIGTRLEFWIEAEDNNDVTGPGVGVSERYFARLVTDEEKRADLWNRASDTLTGVNDLANDQEKLNRGLGELIREKVGGK
jgi:hypothetical protein